MTEIRTQHTHDEQTAYDAQHYENHDSAEYDADYYEEDAYYDEAYNGEAYDEDGYVEPYDDYPVEAEAYYRHDPTYADYEDSTYDEHIFVDSPHEEEDRVWTRQRVLYLIVSLIVIAALILLLVLPLINQIINPPPPNIIQPGSML